jgi:hypothetical protein
MHNLRRCTPLAILLGILSCCLQPACVGSNWVDSCIDRAWESPPPGATTEARWSKAFALEHGDKGCSDRFRLEEFSPAETDRFPCLFPETPLPRQPDHRCDSLLRAPLGSSNSNDTTSFSAARAVVREMCPAASALAESLAKAGAATRKGRSLPQAHLLGVDKCGTTDIYEALHRLLGATTGPKEPSFWIAAAAGACFEPYDGTPRVPRPAAQWRHSPVGLEKLLRPYLADYARLAKAPSGSALAHHSGDGQQQEQQEQQVGTLAIDGNPGRFWQYDVAVAPVPVVMRLLQPAARFVVSFRDPATRVWSAFRYTGAFEKKPWRFQYRNKSARCALCACLGASVERRRLPPGSVTSAI